MAIKKKNEKKEVQEKKPINIDTDLSIEAICKAVNSSDFVKGASGGEMTFSEGSHVLERFSSGCKEIDWALGGGYVRGRIYELFGPESGGKTTVCYAAIASFQKTYPKAIAAYIDNEWTYDEVYAKKCGVDLKRLIVQRPEGGEQALNVMLMLVEKGVSLVVLDSVAALTTKAERDGAIGDSKVGEQARLISSASKKLVPAIGLHNATVLFTNQVRDKIGVMYGNPETTPGGKALRFYASARIRISRKGAIKETIDGIETIVSNEITADVVKSKICVPHRKANFHITFGIGIDVSYSLFNRALKAGVLEKRGSWISMGEMQVAQGSKNVIDMIRTDKVFAQKLEDAISSSSINVPEMDVEEGSADEEAQEIEV